MHPITGYLSIWHGTVCVLPLTAIRGQREWWRTPPNTIHRLGRYTVYFFVL